MENFEEIMEEEPIATTEDTAAPVWDEPISNYDNLTLLGRGASGLVLRGRSTRFSRECALKLLTPDLQHNPGATERFFNEARQMARMRHSHIARGIDCGRSGQYFFYAMEFVRGESVRAKMTRLQSHKLKEAETLRIVRQALDALNHLYNHGILPYDLKANNLLIANDGTLKIADIGVAKDLAFANFEAWTLANAPYVAPEQARGENPDVRSTLYSLGCTWYEMLTGRPPFVGETPSVTLLAQINDAPVPLADIDQKISLATGQLILWLLAKDREKRPRNPQQFLAKMLTHPLVKLEMEKEEDALEKAAQNADADDELLHDRFIDDLGFSDDPAAE